EGHVLRIGVRVFLREAREFLVIAIGIVPQEDRVPVREREEELRVDRTDLVPEAREIQVADDLRPHEARGICEAREPDAWEDLFRHARAADDRAAFEDEDLHPGLREVRRGDEPVVPAAHDDRVPPRLHGRGNAGSGITLMVERHQTINRGLASPRRWRGSGEAAGSRLTTAGSWSAF